MRSTHVLTLLATLLFAVPVLAQEEPASKADVQKRAIEMKSSRVMECSIRNNEAGLGGPIKLRITTDEYANARKVEVLSKRHVKRDLAECVADGSTRMGGPKYPSITFTHEFELHPWAERSRRTWPDVKKVVEEAGVVEALQACRNTHEESQEWMKTHFHFFIQPDGSIDPVFKSPSPMKECLKKGADRLTKFGPAGNKFVVSFVMKKGEAAPTKFDGGTVAPLDCELSGRPCSFADADPEMTKWAMELMDRAMKEKKLGCKNINEVATWLRTQKHVEFVSVSGCDLSLQVKGTRPMGFHGHAHH